MCKEERTAVELEGLTDQFSALISADYMMGKNLPFWGESAQPGKTYYMMKCVMCLVSWQWKNVLEQRYSAIPGITKMRDMLIIQDGDEITTSRQELCYTTSYLILNQKKFDAAEANRIPIPYEPKELATLKKQHLREQHTKYIKCGYIFASFLEKSNEVLPISSPGASTAIVPKKKRGCTYPGCNGSGNTDPSKKRLYHILLL